MVDDLQSSDESAFVTDEIDRIVHQAIEFYLKEKPYNENKVTQWVDNICETCMRNLNELKKPFKYIVTCLIMQKNGAGIHTACSFHLDTVTDGAHIVKWPSDKHKDHSRTMYCIVTVSGLAF